MNSDLDIVVIGGGILGCATALQLRQGGMSVAVLDQSALGQGASGVNAGTLSLQIKRVKLMPYALEGHARWAAMGDAVGFHRSGGCMLAFNEREAVLLNERIALKIAAGAPIRMVAPGWIAEKEPSLSRRVVAASWCEDDGHANASLTGHYYRARLAAAGVPYDEGQEVTAIDESGAGYVVRAGERTYRAQRLLIASGAWSGKVADLLGVHFPVRARVNTVSVTERGSRLLDGVVGHATGLLTMKQKPNGTVLIGGGWQGAGSPSEGRGEVRVSSVVPNISLAQFAVPALARLRIIRSWTGFEANVPDFYPLAGAIPGRENAFILACVRGGYTIGPYMGELMGDLILGREPERPLFDPGRTFDAAA